MAQDPERTDAELAVLASHGARDAFEALVHRFAQPILMVVERAIMDHHQAHDLSQEIWVKVFRALPRFRPEGSFRSWLFSIALNHVRDAKRRNARNKVVYLDQFRSPPPASAASNPRGRTEEQAAIGDAIDKIAEPFRTSLVMIDVLQLSYEEAATALDTKVGTVKSRVNRGRLAFRDHYAVASGDATPRRGGPGEDRRYASSRTPGVST